MQTKEHKQRRPGNKACTRTLTPRVIFEKKKQQLLQSLYYTNLLVPVVLFFSVFVLKTRICPGLAQPVPESSRRPLVHCEARCQALRFYNAQY